MDLVRGCGNATRARDWSSRTAARCKTRITTRRQSVSGPHPSGGLAAPAGPSLAVGHLTLSAAARSFFKVSLLTMKLLLRLFFVVGGIFLTVNLFALDVGALG